MMLHRIPFEMPLPYFAPGEPASGGSGSPPSGEVKPGSTQPSGEAKPDGGNPPDPAMTAKDDAKKSLLGDDAKKEGEKKEEAKPTEAPAQIDLKAIKLPDGFKADEALLNDFAKLLQDTNLTPQTRAQGLLDLHAKQLQAAVSAPLAEYNRQREGWVKSVAADKDIGTGDEKNPLKAEVKTAIAKVVDQYGGGSELRQVLDVTGAGDHPAFIKFLSNISKHLTEGTTVQGSPTTSGGDLSPAQRMYPNLPA